jgi:hypothetical protein
MILLINSTPTLGQSLVKVLVKTPVKPLCLWTPSRTFAAFSKFHLNTSKSHNIKVVQFFKGHNIAFGWHCKFWVEKGEKFGQLQILLFISTMKNQNFAWHSCSDFWEKHRMTFLKVVEGTSHYNFRFWKKCRSVQVSENRAVKHALTGVRNISWHSRARTRVRRHRPAPAPPGPRVAPLPRRLGPEDELPEAAHTPSPLESRVPRMQRVRALVAGLCPRSSPATVAKADRARVPNATCLTHELDRVAPIKGEDRPPRAQAHSVVALKPFAAPPLALPRQVPASGRLHPQPMPRRLPHTMLELPPPLIAPPCFEIHRNPCRGSRSATARPPELAGAVTVQANPSNRLQVSP